MKISLLLFSLLAFALPANAGITTSIEERAAKVEADTEGNNSYHAHLARMFASIAEEEKAQHDLGPAKEFMKMAEEHAAQAGGEK